MLNKTRGIVLHQMKYSDTSIIVHVYTELFGRQSYMVKGAHGRKSKIKANYFSPLFLLELEVSNRNKRELQVITEVRIAEPFTGIPDNFIKSSIALFLAEVLHRALKEEEANLELFNFLYNYIILLDKENQGLQIFHIYFLIQLTHHLGFFPNNNHSDQNVFFDLAEGAFSSRKPEQAWFISRESSKHLAKLMSSSYYEAREMEIHKDYREEILSRIIQYFQMHLISLNDIKSYEVLKEVFAVL